MPKPNLIIAGCQKCGTTWLHASLQGSQAIFGSRVKELNHFNKLDHKDRLPSYLENFPETPGVTYYMESTPHYFQAPGGRVDIAGNIAATLDNPKIIVVFRNPVQRYQSAYIHHMMKERIPYTEQITELTDDQKMLTLGKYAEVLPHWRTIFPGLGVFFYDDLIADKVGFMDKVMDFLDLENDIAPEALDFRTNDKNLKIRKLDANWPVMPSMTDTLRTRLVEYYRNDVNRLQDQTGRDLHHWLTLP